VRFAAPADARTSAARVRDSVVHLAKPDGTVVSLRLEPAPLPLRSLLLLVQGALMSALALVLALRAWREPQARSLAIGFLWIAFNWAEVDSVRWLRFTIELIGDTLIGIGMVALVYFATGWNASPRRFARLLRRAAVPIAIVYLTVDWAGDLSFFHGPAQTDSATASWLFLTLLMIGGLASSAGRARGVERRRIGWILVTMTVAFAPWVAYESLAALGFVDHPWAWIGFTTLVLPFGFGYAMLRHNLVDLGFALNRAAVFAATTALLVGLFGALQWGADQLLVRATGAQDFVVQLTIAVVVLYVVRALRTWTDSFVAHIFFAARRRRIDAILALAHDLDAVDDPEAIAPLVTERLRAGANVEATLTSGAAASGGVAFPLTVRGRTAGALVCVPPPADGDFAPDERAALAALASQIAIAQRLLERSVHAGEQRSFATAAVPAE